MSFPRVILLSSALSALYGSAASAQVGVHVNWTAPGGVPKTCVIASDATGISMDSGGNLVLNGTFGANCPTGEAPLPPVITNGLDAAELPASSTIGASHTVQWSADADRCSYAGSTFPVAVPGWPTSGDICTSAASCATLQSAAVTLPVAGSYTFALTCRRDGVAAPVTSQRTVVVPGNSSCVAPAGLTRLTSAYVAFSNTVGRTADATQFSAIFGYFDDVTPLRPFPGTVNLNQRIFIPHNSYVALEFTVPATLSTPTLGKFRLEKTDLQAPTMSWTISKSCGDFSATPVPPMTAACIKNGAPSGTSLFWSVGPEIPAFCRLQPGETYYLNILHASLATPLTSTCTEPGACGNTLQNAIEAGSVPWPGNGIEP